MINVEIDWYDQFDCRLVVCRGPSKRRDRLSAECTDSDAQATQVTKGSHRPMRSTISTNTNLLTNHQYHYLHYLLLPLPSSAHLIARED